MGGPGEVWVVRSGVRESVHLVDVAVADARGVLVASSGDPERTVFARSSMKPLQAAVSLSLAAAEFDDREIAVMCASHNGEPIHLAVVRSLLDRAGLKESDLQTPAMRPMDEETLEETPTRRPINSDCSGKHGGMLAACVAQRWPLETYRRPDHPLQRAVSAAVALAAGCEPIASGVDGCGVPVHALPLRAMATIYARLGRPHVMGPLAAHVRRATKAMRAEPYLVAGRHRLDTALMRSTAGLVAKGGAEGLACVALLDRGHGVAVRVRDGSHRAAPPAVITVLEQLGTLGAEQAELLSRFARPSVLGGGLPVGELIPDVRLSEA
jgi:L-asparaginase II